MTRYVESMGMLWTPWVCDLFHMALQVLTLYQDKLLMTDSFAGFCEGIGKRCHVKGSEEVSIISVLFSPIQDWIVSIQRPF